ncbi:Starch-binding associating with outer membrane [Dysgonomonas macrotermitis]|uniref:Starch-binding associating with outer membrane n=2 Tax=Dysgonomonas macrotermitis TaxID=1346286 RepID=A0A1M4YES6_9BACT|nr:Starch-binding associating with outer membrane [Dysgonomonas macrotermitis]
MAIHIFNYSNRTLMKKYIYSVIIFACASFFSCEDILDRSSPGKIDSGSMWSSENLAEQGVNGMYQALRMPVWSGSLVGANTNLGYYAWEAFGMTGQTNKSAYGLFSDGNAGNTQFSSVWKWCFTGINRANDAINGLPNTPMDEAKKEQWMAEAKTLRAFFYMRLVELYGRGIGVPLYDEVVTSSTATKGQSSEAEVWDSIIQSLTDAIDTPNFPNNTIGKSGRVSKGVAYALRGKAYLMRSMSLNENHYALAVADFEKVEAMGYSLFGNYADMFKVSNEGNSEMLMVVQNIALQAWADASNLEPQYGSSVQKYCAPYQAGSKDSRGCWNDIQISPAAVDYFEVLVDDSTVKPFNWNDFIPGYNETGYADRMVYFLRNTKNSAGVDLHANITREVNLKLGAISSANSAKYLPSGNEERIKTVYANRDPRLAASIVTPYSSFVGVNSGSTGVDEYIYRWPALGMIYFDGANAESTLVPGMKSTLTSNNSSVLIYMFRKFVTEGLELDYRNTSPVDEPILRFADVLLMKAEALVELNKLSDAKSAVAQVRSRVGMPTMDKYFASQSDARNYVRDERRREFVGEGVNFFDEMRWKTIKETKFEYASRTALQVTGASAVGPTYVWRDSWYTWPVPKEEAEKNSNLKRTPGWTY